ncbi:MAG: hypothetical protein ACYC4L_04310 [Chloroflexota bacterium]
MQMDNKRFPGAWPRLLWLLVWAGLMAVMFLRPNEGTPPTQIESSRVAAAVQAQQVARISVDGRRA